MHIPAVAANIRPIADYPKQVNDVVRSFPGDWASAVTLACVRFTTPGTNLNLGI